MVRKFAHGRDREKANAQIDQAATQFPNPLVENIELVKDGTHHHNGRYERQDVIEDDERFGKSGRRQVIQLPSRVPVQERTVVWIRWEVANIAERPLSRTTTRRTPLVRDAADAVRNTRIAGRVGVAPIEIVVVKTSFLFSILVVVVLSEEEKVCLMVVS